MKHIAMLLLLASPVALAGGTFSTPNPFYQGSGSQMGGKAQGNGQLRTFHAWGTHVCWHEDNIGHRCEVEGWDFVDTNDAVIRLNLQDCCKQTKFGGRSQDFKFMIRMNEF